MGEVSRIVSGGTPRTDEIDNYRDGDIPWITPADLSGYNEKYISRGRRNITEKGMLASSAVLMPAGSVLFSSRAPIGYVAIAQNDLTTNQGFKSFVLQKELEPHFLYYYLKFAKALALELASGTTFQEISGRSVALLPIVIPPHQEQLRVIAKIEEIFSDLDAGIVALERARANVKRYRASVLKAAVEGRLTAEWRKSNPPTETGAELLARILKEREKQSANQQVNNTSRPRKESIACRDKCLPPLDADTNRLPGLPDGWCWARVAIVGDVIGGLTKNPKRAALPKKLPYLRVANVYANELRLEEIEEIGVEDEELERLLLNEGDLLIVEGNGSPDQIGRVAVWDGSITPCVHQNHLIKVRMKFGCTPRWGLNWFLSLDGRRHIRNIASSTSGLYTLSVGKVRSLPIPLPPIAEQTEITNEIESRLSIADATEKTIDSALKRAARLRQAILKRAFEGRLVPQDPNDEPASALLERIRAERAKQKPAVSKRTRKTEPTEPTDAHGN